MQDVQPRRREKRELRSVAGRAGIRSISVWVPWHGRRRTKYAAVLHSEAAIAVRTDDLIAINEVTGVAAPTPYDAAADVISRDIAGTEYVPACDTQSGVHGL